jgi:hypothetical protein
VIWGGQVNTVPCDMEVYEHITCLTIPKSVPGLFLYPLSRLLFLLLSLLLLFSPQFYPPSLFIPCLHLYLRRVISITLPAQRSTASASASF